MKYTNLEVDYTKTPFCKENLLRALFEIGKNDPMNVERYTLKRKHNNENMNSELTERQLIKRGVLNVRMYINRNLGKNGKVSNRMIYKMSNVREKILKSGEILLAVKLPHDQFMRIAGATYILLYNCNPYECKRLLHLEENDEFSFKKANNNIVLRCVVPIQTNITIRAIGKNEKAEKFIQYIKNIMG